MRMSVTRLPPPLLQVLIIMSSDDAGLGNRLQAMLYAFLFAIVSNRLLLIDWAENANQIVRACFVLLENFRGGRLPVLSYCNFSLTTLHRVCATATAHDAASCLLCSFQRCPHFCCVPESTVRGEIGNAANRFYFCAPVPVAGEGRACRKRNARAVFRKENECHV